MHSLNRQRANLVLSDLLEGRDIPTPERVSFNEHIFEWDGVLRWRGSAPFARARIGISLQKMLSALAPAHYVTGATRDDNSTFQTLVNIHQNEDFLVWYCTLEKTTYIVLKKGASAKTQLKAWAISLDVAHQLQDSDATSATPAKVLQVIASSLTEVSNQWDDSIDRMHAVGWDTNIASLETTSGKRICLHEQDLQEKLKIGA